MLSSIFHRGTLAALLVGALTAATVVAGCGDSGSAPTKEEFVKRADAVCKKADARQLAGLKLYTAKHEREGSSKAWEEKLAKAAGLPPLQAEAEELGKLEAPAGAEGEVEAIVDAIDEAVEKGEADPASVVLPPGSNAFAEAEKMAREYGMKVCGEV